MSRYRKVLSTKEVARILGLNPATVRKYITDGRIPNSRPTGKYRIPLDWVLSEKDLTIEQFFLAYPDIDIKFSDINPIAFLERHKQSARA